MALFAIDQSDLEITYPRLFWLPPLITRLGYLLMYMAGITVFVCAYIKTHPQTQEHQVTAHTKESTNP